VLAKIAEKNLHLSLRLYEETFFLRPITLILITITVITIVFTVLGRRRERKQGGGI